MDEHSLLWAMLPEGLEGFFELQQFEKTDDRFRIVLMEKNIIPADLPGEYRGKKVINTITSSIIIDDFPIRGRKGELMLKRRSWKFEGVDKLLKRDIKVCSPGTKLEQEFAAFLKAFPGNPADFY